MPPAKTKRRRAARQDERATASNEEERAPAENETARIFIKGAQLVARPYFH